MGTMDLDKWNATIKAQFDGLNPLLQRAARYAVGRPEEIGLNSIRRAAANAGVQPFAMVRLAQELSFPSYNEFREPFPRWLRGGPQALAIRAQDLRDRSRR